MTERERRRSRKKEGVEVAPDTISKYEAVSAEKLRVASYNPRKIKDNARMRLRKSIEEFGFPNPIIANSRKGREGVIVGGHQRFRIAKDLGWSKFPVVWVDLSYEKEKELNLRLNDNYGEFDLDILKEEFDAEVFNDIGLSFQIPVMTDYEQKLESLTDAKAEMPIVQQYNEQYKTVMIISKTELDWNWLKQALKLRTEKCYKSSTVAESAVITVEDLQEIFDEIEDG